MRLNTKTLMGIALLTANWPDRRQHLFDFCCNKGGERWQDEDFRSHMMREYFSSSEPLTLRFYELDIENVKLILSYIDERLMANTADYYID